LALCSHAKTRLRPQTSAWHVDGNAGEKEYWMGSLVDGMRDASGQIYSVIRFIAK